MARNRLCLGFEAPQELTSVAVEWRTGKFGVWHIDRMRVASDRSFDCGHTAVVGIGLRFVATVRSRHKWWNDLSAGEVKRLVVASKNCLMSWVFFTLT